MGRLVVMQVIGASAEIGGVAYVTGPERGTGKPFVIGQAFAEGDAIMADFVDPNFERILVSLRVTWDGSESWTGTLFTPDLTVPVTCWEG
ncbi:MAG: hypothetical protein KIT02_02400 [Devosia sp.]|uniref:hypothetical protein n=1 Tax=Devosia sp. TaxID=1871048 RepID=UPI0024CBDC11|nr:hypothetical protein [Devosia sp.]UYO00104.1 MAG: hypothetical protein KIT02_02400 [Devosia sp.]